MYIYFLIDIDLYKLKYIFDLHDNIPVYICFYSQKFHKLPLAAGVQY